MKRYLLFTYEDYYPCGGWNDFRGSFDTPAEAMAQALHLRHGNADLVDSQTGQEVEFSYQKARFAAPGEIAELPA